MDWLTTIAAGIIGCVSGNIALFVFFPQMRRMKNIENEAKQSEEWRKLYIEAKNETKELSGKIDSLYIDKGKQRDQEVLLHQTVAELSVENTKLKILKCELPACGKRTPPTGF